MNWLLGLLACSSFEAAPERARTAGTARIREPNLQITSLEVGGTVGIEVSFGTPGEDVRVYAGARPGAGPCWAWLQGACLGIRSPDPVASGTIGADGTARFRIAIPSSLVVGDAREFQAVVHGALPSLSNVVSRTVRAAGDVPQPPGTNVLVVLLDDVGRDKLAAYGSTDPAPTPAIDALAAEGVTFDNAYSRPMCVSARASLQTGRHGRRTGVGINWTETDPWELGLEQITLPEMLAMSPYHEYTNAFVGKWHLGSPLGASGLAHPALQGWSDYAGSFSNLYVVGQGYDSYFDWLKTENGTQVRSTTYATTDTIDDAIERVGALSEPWLIVVSLNAGHAPLEEPPLDLMPIPSAPGRGFEVRQMVAAADTEIGRLLATMDSGVRARTTVFLTADNGTLRHQTQPPVDELRGKGTLFDGGVRVPFIVSGAGIGVPGARSDALVDLVDVYPTVAEIAGVRLDGLGSVRDAAVPYAIDGESLLPVLADPTRNTRRPYLYSETFGPPGPGPYTDIDRQTIRNERYKLVVDNLSGLHQFFAYEPGVSEEGENLLACGLTAAQQSAYDRLLAALQAETAALVYDAEPFPEWIGIADYPYPDDTGVVVCAGDTGP